MAPGKRAPKCQKYIGSEDEFLRKALNLKRPGLAAVRRALRDKDHDRAWRALFSYFAKRRRPQDPALEAWKRVERSAVGRAVRSAREDLADWRVNGKVDWDHDNRPSRADWEKYWSRGRMHHLRLWAAAAECSGKAELRRAVARSFLEWFEDRPVPELPHLKYWHQGTHGFNWRELEVATRGRFLISLFLAAVRWPRVSEAFLRKLLISIRQHLDYLRTYYATFGFIEGNHQNHHSEAPLAAGVLLPELRGASCWRALGLRICREHIKSDFDVDCVQNEYSAAYHSNVLGIYLDAYEILKVNRQAMPGWLDSSVRKMAEFVFYATGPDGWRLLVNDSGPGKSEPLRKRAARSLAMPELLGPGGGKGKRCRLGLSKAYFPAGLAFMRSDASKDATCVVLDATKHNSGHWHAGKPNLLIQSGSQQLACEHIFGDYDDPSFWQYFHNAQAHNTVMVDGEGDGVPESPWRYSHISKPDLNFFVGGKRVDIARATTDGFHRMKPRVNFERTVIFVKPGLVLVHDVLDSRGEHCYEWLMHFLPGKLIARSRSRSLRTAFGGGSELLCSPVSGEDSDLIGPLVRYGKTRNRTIGVPTAGREYWSPPAAGESPELLADAPYAVWSQVGNRVTFDFVLQVLKPNDEPVKIDALEAELPHGTAAYKLSGKRGTATVLLDDRRAASRKPLCAGGMVLSGRVGVAAGSGRKGELLTDGRLSREERRRKAHR